MLSYCGIFFSIGRKFGKTLQNWLNIINIYYVFLRKQSYYLFHPFKTFSDLVGLVAWWVSSYFILALVISNYVRFGKGKLLARFCCVLLEEHSLEEREVRGENGLNLKPGYRRKNIYSHQIYHAVVLMKKQRCNCRCRRKPQSNRYFFWIYQLWIRHLTPN